MCDYAFLRSSGVSLRLLVTKVVTNTLYIHTYSLHTLSASKLQRTLRSSGVPLRLLTPKGLVTW